MGLLSKANLLDSKTGGLAFSNFIRKYNIKCCALFEKINDSFYITNSIGFDYNSIKISKSTNDFWNNINESQDLSIFKQFFSSDLSEKIKTINVIRINSNSIFMLCNSIISDSMKEDLHSIDSSNLLNEYENITDNEGLYSKIIVSIKNIDSPFFSSISNEIFNRFINTLFREIKISKNNDNIKFLIPVSNDFDSQLFLNHLLINLSDLFLQPAEYINIDVSNADKFANLLDF